MLNKFLKGVSLWLVIIIIAIWLANIIGKPGKEEKLTYSEFKNTIKIGKLIECSIKEDSITGFYQDGDKKQKFKTVPLVDAKLIEELEAAGVKYEGAKRNWLGVLFFSFGPILLFMLFWIFLMRQAQGGGKQALTFGRSRARLQSPSTKKKITFKDVAGCDEVKEELQEIISFLKEPKKFQKLGGKIPKGVLLFGAPGTGKTLLAKAVAGEASVPFFSCSGSEFVEMFVGVGASRVRDLFERGRKNAPCLLFVDEIDAVGRHRFSGIGGGHDEREQTLNQLLVEMDGFDTTEGVILIAATNRPDVLDPALLRPGRFDRQVIIPNPDLRGREEILKVHARNIKMSSDVNMKVIAQRTVGFVGSDLANVVNEAALLAARKDKKSVGTDDLEEAIDRVIAGPERKSRVISEKEKKIIAIHEAGHALIVKFVLGTHKLHKISIIPRGPALGYTMPLPVEDRYLKTKSEFLDEITTDLGGRVAEEEFFSEITNGDSSDLLQATKRASKMVRDLGMSEKIGPLVFKQSQGDVFLGRDIAQRKEYSERTAEIIDSEVKKIIDECYNRAKVLIKEHKNLVKRIADAVLEKEVLEGSELEKIFDPQEKKDNRNEKENKKEKIAKKEDKIKKTKEEKKG